MDQKTNYLSLILLDALEDENESDINFILDRNSETIDPGYVPQDRGIAPLHYVCGMDNDKLAIEITRRFLQMGANPNCKTDDDMTPLHVAAIYGKVEIVRLLLKYGADLEVYDIERKSPILYAFENCFFDVVQILRDHIFLAKYEKKKQKHSLSESKFEISLQSKSTDVHSTPQRKSNAAANQQDMASNVCINKNLLKVTNANESLVKGAEITTHENGQFTPNRINYNYDVTSPYYINITHRRHRPQPMFPDKPIEIMDENITLSLDTKSNKSEEDILSISMQGVKLSSPESVEYEQSVNIFSLTQENLKELTQRHGSSERSRKALIEKWRERVQNTRPSVVKQYDNINEMIEEVIESDHLNFTNTKLIEKPKNALPKDAEIDSGACGSTSPSILDETEYFRLPLATATRPQTAENTAIPLAEGIQEPQKLASFEATKEFPLPNIELPNKLSPSQVIDLDSSYQTVPEIFIEAPIGIQEEDPDTSTNFIRSPKNNDFFLQMAEAYVHTDDENGLVFYETKLPSNVGNKMANRRQILNGSKDLDTSVTTQSTNVTIPMDYETDTLRAELTIYGEPPGPITKTTKRLYVKRLMKYKRKTDVIPKLQANCRDIEAKFSVELQRTLKSEDNFLRIQDYMKYETQSMQFFVNNQDKKQLREGHLKQSFIYMLIDPRISCNLPGESVFLEKFQTWQRFLHSIFYVGKGKTSRPYSHLYDAMKTHSRLHHQELNEKLNKNGKKISIKKQPLNVDIFKSPPQKSSNSKKLDRILDIWGNGYGVVCLHVFHNIVPTEAYTREAAIIDALSVQQLTNCKRGDYYGPAKTWTMKEKKYLGIALLYKAMHMYLAEGESQLSPGDLV